MSFLAIITTSVIVLMTVLMSASEIRGNEALLTGILTGQQDLLLSSYSEKLLDWYGIFATRLQNTKDKQFLNAVCEIEGVDHYSCKGIYPLEKDNRLKEAIADFSGLRAPMQILLQFMSRFTKINSIISGRNTQSENVIPDSPTKPKDDQDTSMTGSEIDYEKILESLSSIDKGLFEKCMQSGETSDDNEIAGPLSWERFNSSIQNAKTDMFYELDVSKQIKSQLTVTESNLNDISSFLEQFYQIKANPIYEKLCFEFYITSMFSCKTNTLIQNGINVQRKDMRNRIIDTLPTRSKLEIEKIIFGYEKDETNDFFIRISIESMRFLCHLITNLTDKTKRTEIKSVSIGLCAAILLASGGTVAIPSTVMDTVVLLLFSINSAAADYKALACGKAVPALPLEETKNIDTYYIDYLQLLLLMVPEQLKIERMLIIIKSNLFMENIDLYTGVLVTTKYRNNWYKVEGRYGGYEKVKN